MPHIAWHIEGKSRCGTFGVLISVLNAQEADHGGVNMYSIHT